MNTKRVMMITPFAAPNIGGVESHIEKLLKRLPGLGYDVLIVTYQPLTTKARGLALERSPGIVIKRVRWFGHGWFPKLEPFFPLMFLWLFPRLWLAALITYWRERRRITVIHAHGLIAATIAKTIKAMTGVRVVVSIHAIYHFSDRRLLGSLVKWILHPADAIITVGSPARAELVEMGLAASRIHILHNWVDLDVFYPHNREECRRALDLQGFVVLFIGRLLAKKGIPLLLEAARSIPQGIFMFVGDGPEAVTLKKAAQQHRNIIFRGKVSESDLVRYYSAADLFAQPALYDEGAAAVFLEAIACGTPVIASRLGCTSDYLDPSVAILIEPTVSVLVSSLSELYTHPDRLAHLRSACRAYAERHYSDRNIKIFQQSYSASVHRAAS